MRYILFLVALAFAVTVLLISMPSESRDEDLFPRGGIIDTKEGHECCTFEVNGETKSCAAVEGRTCAACYDVCKSFGQ